MIDTPYNLRCFCLSYVELSFNSPLGLMLSIFCIGSADHTLCVNSWNEFLITTKILMKNMDKRELELNVTPPFLLQHDQVRWVKSHSSTFGKWMRLTRCHHGRKQKRENNGLFSETYQGKAELKFGNMQFRTVIIMRELKTSFTSIFNAQ